MNPEVCSCEIAEDPPKHPCFKYEWSVVSDCWDISIWKTLTQCDGNRNANAQAHVDDRGDYNCSLCTLNRRAKIKAQSLKGHNSWNIFRIYSKDNQIISSLPIYSSSYEALAPTFFFHIFCWQGKMPKFTFGHHSCPDAIGPSHFLLTYFFMRNSHMKF